LRSSQSGWCSETCQELDVGCDKSDSASDITKSNDFMSDEWIVFLRQSASEVKFLLLPNNNIYYLYMNVAFCVITLLLQNHSMQSNGVSNI